MRPPSELVFALAVGLCACPHAPMDSLAPGPSPCVDGLARISVMVVDAMGRPAPEHHVNVEDPKMPWWSDWDYTDTDGHFDSGCYPPRPHELSIRGKEGFLRAEVMPGEPKRLVIDEGGSIEGVVLDLAGNPASAKLYLESTEPRGPSLQTGTKNGRFMFAHVPPGEYSLNSDVDITHGTISQRARTGTKVLVERNHVSTVSMRVEPMALVGTVVDSSGRPVPGARVSARSDSVVKLAKLYRCNSVAGAKASGTTDSQGRFRFEAATEEPWHLTAWTDQSESSSLTVTPPFTETNLVLVSNEQKNLTGRVLSGGRPISQFKINGWAVTSVTGAFSVPKPLSYEITVEAADHLPRTLRLSKAALGDIVLTPARMVRGEVLDSAGRPDGTATVRWRSADSTLASVSSTHPLGRFIIETAGPGELSVETETAATSIVLSATDDALVVRLPAPARIEGRLLDQNGRPLPMTLIELVRASKPTRVSSDSHGAYSVVLRPGRYGVDLPKLDGHPPLAPIDAVSGRTTKADIRLAARTGTLVVRLDHAPARLAPTAFLIEGLRAVSSWEQMAAFIEGAAAATFEKAARRWSFAVRPGRYTLAVYLEPEGEPEPTADRVVVHTRVIEVEGPAPTIGIDLSGEGIEILRPVRPGGD